MSFKTYTIVLAAVLGSSLTVQATPTPTATCEEPPQWTGGYLDYDAYCKCDGTYSADSPTFGIQYQGLVRCETVCAPTNEAQREAHNEPEHIASLAACSNACTGSFEKRKRQDDDYWFCHGVNFKEGELCEFFGSLGDKAIEDQAFEAGGSDCWYLPGLD
ncbi:hypothetical protein GGS20DRAFT_542912 [Poronia punctata]|nr:hypothetical protein GGS20DRAFT_542912 [Poronia punctata]